MEFPSDERQRWVLSRLSRLFAAGAEPVSGLVRPDEEHFPEPFDGSPASFERLMARVAGFAGLSGVPLRLAISAEDGQNGSCSSGGCGTGVHAPAGRTRFERTADGAYGITLAVSEARHPTILTTLLAEGVAAAFLGESGALPRFGRAELGGVIDLCAVMLGFGILVANGSFVYMKSCGGARAHQTTALGVEETTLALAVYCELFDAPPREARGHLDPTARAAFDEAGAWARANRGVVRLVRSDPGAIEAGTYALSEGRSWLGRILGLGRARGASVPTDDELTALERELRSSKPRGGQRADSAEAEARRKRLAELRALVDESLDG